MNLQGFQIGDLVEVISTQHEICHGKIGILNRLEFDDIGQENADLQVGSNEIRIRKSRLHEDIVNLALKYFAEIGDKKSAQHTFNSKNILSKIKLICKKEDLKEWLEINLMVERL